MCMDCQRFISALLLCDSDFSRLAEIQTELSFPRQTRRWAPSRLSLLVLYFCILYLNNIISTLVVAGAEMSFGELLEYSLSHLEILLVVKPSARKNYFLIYNTHNNKNEVQKVRKFHHILADF